MLSDSDKVLEDIFSVSQELYKDMSDYISDVDHSKLFGCITRLGTTLSRSEMTRFWKWDKRSHTLWTLAPDSDMKVIPDSKGLVGRALAEGRVIITNDPLSHPDFDPEVDRRSGCETRSVLVMPVSDINGEFIGAYQAINKLEGSFSEEDCRRLSLAAVICGVALESELFLAEAHHDSLTGLKNRMGFYRDFARYLKLVDQGTPLSLFICDIDWFKSINDAYGHNAGDQVLRHTAAMLTECCGEDSSVYRWGGEEFIMVMAGADLKTCADKAEEIRVKIMGSVCRAEGSDISLTLSFGAAAYDPDLTIEENIKAADTRLYTAKESGRNRVVY